MSQVRSRNAIAVELALLATSLASGLGALRLTTSPTQARPFFSVAAAVVVGHWSVYVVQRFGRRYGHRLTGVAIGVVFVALVSSWISVPASTFYGIPTGRTISALSRLFDQAGRIIRSHPTPLPPTSGVVLCLVAGAGLASVLSRALFGSTTSTTTRSASALVPLIPTFGLLAYTAVLSSGVDRVTGAIAYIAAASVFLVVSDLPKNPSREPSTSELDRPQLVALHRASGDGHSHTRVRNGSSAGLAAVATAVVLALALSPSLAGMRLDALPFKGAGGGASQNTAAGGSGGAGTASASEAQGSIGVIDLVANLQGVLTSRSQQVMFDARSPIPTYWQVGTLTSFTGSEWTPDPATARSSGQVPASPSASGTPPLPVLPQPGPAATPTYSTQVSLVGLGGHLLPVPPDTIAVSGPGTTLDPAIGAIYGQNQAREASAGLSYVAVAESPSDSAAAAANSAGSPSVTSAELAPYLSLPSSVPSVVVSIAQQITAGAVGPAAKAEALAQWFDSGLFRYTLDPPPPAPGEGPLLSFLLVYRAGFCQQFAGAYAVLARSIGLPTRLAVGFATGVPVGNADKKSESELGTTYRITGADAHVWPEVYLGAQAGWVSFEPTPPSPNEPSPVGVVEGSASPASIGALPPTSTTQAGPARAATSRSGRSGPARRANLWAPLAVGVGIAAFLAALAAAAVFLRRLSLIPRLRRLRSRRPPRHAGANERVLSRMDRASRGLRRAGLGRRHTETLEEHVGRLGDTDTAGERLSALGPYRELARLAERASYARDPCTEADAAQAERLCEQVTSSLRPHRSPVRR